MVSPLGSSDLAFEWETPNYQGCITIRHRRSSDARTGISSTRLLLLTNRSRFANRTVAIVASCRVAAIVVGKTVAA
jgi:hypothetical protein